MGNKLEHCLGTGFGKKPFNYTQGPRRFEPIVDQLNLKEGFKSLTQPEDTISNNLITNTSKSEEVAGVQFSQKTDSS